jgi:hypothetical protein
MEQNSMIDLLLGFAYVALILSPPILNTMQRTRIRAKHNH